MPSIGISAGISASASISGGISAGINAGLSLGGRQDPYLAYRFLVEIDGIIVGGFSEVSGLSIQTQVDPKMFGGDNNIEYKFITGTKYTDLTLKHGLSDIDLLWSWYDDVVYGKVARKNGTIYLLDSSGVPAIWWDFIDAFPIKWDGPTLNASNATVATESLVLTHQGLSKPTLSQALSAAKGIVSASLSGAASITGTASLSATASVSISVKGGFSF